MSEETTLQLKASGYKWGENPELKPTLSELIIACGTKFDMLVRNRKGEFLALGYSPHPLEHCSSRVPEEAVAKLFIALKKPVI